MGLPVLPPTSPSAGPAAPIPLRPAVVAHPSRVVATDAAGAPGGHPWTLASGLPWPDKRVLDLSPTGGSAGPGEGGPDSGVLAVKTRNRLAVAGASPGVWLHARVVGGWLPASIRVEPDDGSGLDASLSDSCPILDSRFRSHRTLLCGGHSGEEERVTGQILALPPGASG